MSGGGDWYYEDNNRPQGPCDWSEMSALIQRNTLTKDTLVWREGWSGWRPLAESDLRALVLPTFRAGPPPLPFRNPFRNPFRLLFLLLLVLVSVATLVATQGRGVVVLWSMFTGERTEAASNPDSER